MGTLGGFMAALGAIGMVLARPSVLACESGVNIARAIGTVNPQQTCNYWQWGWEGSACLLGVGALLFAWGIGRAVLVGLWRGQARRA